MQATYLTSLLVLRFIYEFACLHRPLHVAARNGLTVVVQELLGKGASVLAVDENGKKNLCSPVRNCGSKLNSLKNSNSGKYR